MNKLLNQLNSDYLELHQKYETLFWDFYMGDYSLETEMNLAKQSLENFKSNRSLSRAVDAELALCDDSEIKHRLEKWRHYFELHQIPDGLKDLKQQISELEVSVEAKRSSRSEGYTDPSTGEWVEMSVSQMRSRMVIEKTESMRKVLYNASNEIIKSDAQFLVELVPLRNQFAQQLGYSHYYEYMARTRDQLDCEYVRNIFDELYQQTNQAIGEFIEQKKLENPILNRPWNRSHFLSGSFVQEEDPYYPLSEQLLRWGQTMTGWGVDFQGATLKFDFLERKGKLNNGFCHQPIPLHTNQDGSIHAAVIGFTTTAIPGDIGEGSEMGMTLFHEGGHALHFATMAQPDIILNTEYPPSTTAWAEVQSMTLDSIYSSFEWSQKYGSALDGTYYPRELYEKRISQLKPMSPMMQYQIMLVTQFERWLYQQTDLTTDIIIQKAGELGQKYLLFDEPQYFCLAPMHIYSSENACMYHSYGLADMAVEQIKSHIIKQDGYLVDNKNLISLLRPYQQLGSSGELLGYMRQMLGYEFSPHSLVNVFNRTIEEQLEFTKSVVLESQKHQAYLGPVIINAICEIRHGKEKIADNSISFEDMCDTFRQFLTDYDRT